jgi:predicted XRE-type DNA-binding protein
MKKGIINNIEYFQGSGNVYADLNVPESGKLKIKTDLVIQIRKAISRLDLNQEAAAKRMGISQPKVSGMMRGDFSNLSERKLMDCLAKLGYNIEIRIKPVKSQAGRLMVAAL